MKCGVCITLTDDGGASRDRLVDGARRVERLGFDGLWFFDTIGRARALPDPLISASVAAAVTEKSTSGPVSIRCRCAIQWNWRTV